MGRVIKYIHPLGYESVFEYDAVGRIVRAVSHLGDDWVNSPAVNSVNPYKPNNPTDYGVRYKTGKGGGNPPHQGQVPFVPSSMVGHGFMTEDMVIEDGEGRRFEPQAPQPPMPLPTPEPHPNAPQPGPAPHSLPPRTEPRQNDNYDWVIYLVHGTTGIMESGFGNGPGHWLDYYGEESFIEFLMDEFNIPRGDVLRVEWGGDLSMFSRRISGNNLASHIYSQHGDTNTNMLIAAYSHGGNVAKRTINRLSRRYDFDLNRINLVNFAVPARTDYRLNRNARNNINFYANVFNLHDSVQLMGTSIFPEGYGFVWVDGKPVFVEAGRLSPFAKNILVSSYIPTGPFESHGAMHTNINVWRHYVLHHIIQSINGEGGCGQ